MQLNLNDNASEIPLRGVRYEVSLISEKEISHEDLAYFNFEVLTDSNNLQESIEGIQPLYLNETTNEFVYMLAFESIYREYSEHKLEVLMKERNFVIQFDDKGVKEILKFN